jgi:hypothetical protein
MTELLEEIGKCAEHELSRANKKFPMFHSGHEAYGVIKEEVEETASEMNSINDDLGILWFRVKTNEDAACVKNALVELSNSAMKCAAEACQVAAMAVKAIESMKSDSSTQSRMK